MNPGSHTVKTDTSEAPPWLACLRSAIRYFHAQLDHEDEFFPEGQKTARDYFHDRGWTDETIRSQSLGWAPAGNENTLVSHLRQDGFEDEVILATGLFTKGLDPLWNGRYVIPYLDASGQPVYAIGRALDSESLDTHPDDFLEGKYAKLAHSKDYVKVAEPIFGLESLQNGKPVIITEGIADAITVQQEGYPCLSPVTTHFTQENRNRLLTILSEYEVPLVFIIQDAEYPTSAVNDTLGQLDLSKMGPGLEGALATAEYLTDNGVTVRVNIPPQPDTRKYDLDDYIREGWGSVAALLRSAKPPGHYPIHDPPTVDRETSNSPDENGEINGQISALNRLDITDVTGLPIGYRGKNPLGHTGDSEKYFVITDNDGKVSCRDHKRKANYTTHTYLLCEAGERPVNAPEGKLSNREMFIAWKQAHKRGVLPADDPIPHRALMHIAVSHDLCDPSEIRDGWYIPKSAYKGALAVVRDEYSLEPGREPNDERNDLEEYDYTPPITATSESATIPKISLDEARERAIATVFRAAAESRVSLIDALPAQGKSRAVIERAAKTERPVIVLAPRRDLLKSEYTEWCEEFGLTWYQLPAHHRDCESANGTHGKRWQQRVNELYQAGLTGGEIHSLAERKFGRSLPCQEHGPCAYDRKWDFDSEDYDVLLGHYTHAYREDLLEGRDVVLDESPHQSYLHNYTRSEVASAVTHYLDRHDGLPFENYTDLIENRSDPYRNEDALAWFEQENPVVERDGYSVIVDSSGNAHAFAPLMTYALLVGEDLGNGWEHATLPGNRLAARDRDPQERGNTTEPELSLLIPPSFEKAETVIGLDGTPFHPRWEQCLGEPVDHYPVFDDNERSGYLRHGLGYRLYQMCDNSKPYSSGYHVSPENDRLHLEQIAAWERRLPDLITSRKALNQYDDTDMSSLYGKTGYYGNLKGTNAFKHSRLGVVIGSPHYGDKYVERWGAIAGERVERGGKGMNLDYGEYGTRLLRIMREGEVLQAFMRFGRDGKGATIYVVTGALPEWVRSNALEGTGRLIQWSDGMRQVIDTIGDRESFRTADLLVSSRHQRVLQSDGSEPLSERQTNRNLTTLYEYGFLDRRVEGTGWRWYNVGLEKVNGSKQAVRSRERSA